MAIEEKIRELAKEELDAQLEEIREQLSSVSSRARKFKDELFLKSEEFDENAEK